MLVLALVLALALALLPIRLGERLAASVAGWRRLGDLPWLRARAEPGMIGRASVQETLP